MLRELEPIEPEIDQLWPETLRKLLENPNSIVLVKLRKPSDNKIFFTFHASIITEGDKTMLQLEDLNPAEFAESFFVQVKREWEVNIGGIYRLPIKVTPQ